MNKITLEKLHVDCNIGKLEIQGLTICAKPGEHTVVVVDVVADAESVGYVAGNISGQPLSVRADDEILFYGVIHTATEHWSANLLTLKITAYSLSFLLDLEKKSRSFQKTNKHHAEVIGEILKEYDSYAIDSFLDKPIEKPLIQYQETDWEFIRRATSRCGAQVIPAYSLNYLGLYLGFPERPRSKTEAVEYVAYRMGIDEKTARTRTLSKRHLTYYEVEDFAHRRLGDLVLFRGRTLIVSELNARLSDGALIFVYRLVNAEYNEIHPIYNPSMRGLSIIGEVLDRQAEKLRLHLKIDEAQQVEDAYFYTWLPETGNIMYNMPPVGTIVSLHMQNSDEQSAICIRNIRENGSSNALTQNTAERYSTTEHSKSFSMKPETMDLAVFGSKDFALIDDNFGCLISSNKEVLIQAKGNVSITGTNVNLRAPDEVTAVRRDLVSSTVLNLCHNIDTAGGKGEFYVTGKYYNSYNLKKGKLTTVTSAVGTANKKAEREKRKKLRFKMEELIKHSKKEPQYDISDMFQVVLSAIPQQPQQDELARLAIGSKVTVGSWAGNVPSKRTSYVPVGEIRFLREEISNEAESRGEK